MTLRTVLKDIQKIAEDYYLIDKSYNDLEQLQLWKQHLSYYQFFLVDNYQKEIAKNKIYHEGGKSIVRLEAYERLKSESNSSQEKVSDTALMRQSDGSEEYKEWLKTYSESYARYKSFEMYMETLRNLIYSIGSHQNMLIKGGDKINNSSSSSNNN